MFETDDILWGSAPGQGPELRNCVESETAHANDSWPGLWFFGAILVLFFILIPIFIAWNFISPRTFREFNYGPHPIFIPAKEHHPHKYSQIRASRNAAIPAGSARHSRRGQPMHGRNPQQLAAEVGRSD